jgi:ABC-2 type transport system ATP-binding protein
MNQAMLRTDRVVGPILEVRHVSKHYGDVIAVDDASFEVREGEIFGFLGPNGAGKTTTINMLTGLANVTQGQIFYQGREVTHHLKNVQGLLGIVPDESNLYDELNGFENLCFCGALYGLRKTEREPRARQLLEQFGLADAGKKIFKAYSKGMKRKLTIAAGLIHQPPILFLDEPTTGIDVASARQIRTFLKALNQQGTTLFLTTHYIEEAERLCDRIAFIVKGKVVKIGTLEELMQHTQQKHIIQFRMERELNRQQLTTIIGQALPELTIHIVNHDAFQIHADQEIDIFSILSILHDQDIKTLEAKLIKPSLEEVFVDITGIELEHLRKEKEGKKK